MTYAAPLSRSAWYADGLRWIGSVFYDTADAIDRARVHAETPLEPITPYRPIDEFIYDVRFRIQSKM